MTYILADSETGPPPWIYSGISYLCLVLAQLTVLDGAGIAAWAVTRSGRTCRQGMFGLSALDNRLSARLGAMDLITQARSKLCHRRVHNSVHQL